MADAASAPLLSVVSESAFTVGDHGVHTAFVEQVRALRALGATVAVNDVAASKTAALTVVHSPGPFGRRCLRAAGTRGVAYAHVTPDTLRDSIRLERAWRPVARAYLRSFYRGAARVVAVSPTARQELVGLGIDAMRIVEIPNGIDGARILDGVGGDHVELVRRRRGPTRPLVLGVGQVQRRKGVDRFVDVAQAVPECDFVWVGGRPFGVLTERGRGRGRLPANVRFAGRVSDRELLAHYHAADVFLFPSRQENFGQVVVEAAAAGLPLVLSDLPVFRQNFAGAATLCRTGPELAAAVAALAADPRLRAGRAEAARPLAERFSARRAAAALLALVDERADAGCVEPAIPDEGAPA